MQADGFRDHHAEIAAARAVVLGISPDPVEKLRRWREAQGYPFDLLSDPDHVVLAKLGANPAHLEAIELLHNRVEAYQRDIEAKVPDTDLPCEIRRCIDGEGV